MLLLLLLPLLVMCNTFGFDSARFRNGGNNELRIKCMSMCVRMWISDVTDCHIGAACLPSEETMHIFSIMLATMNCAEIVSSLKCAVFWTLWIYRHSPEAKISHRYTDIRLIQLFTNWRVKNDIHIFNDTFELFSKRKFNRYLALIVISIYICICITLVCMRFMYCVVYYYLLYFLYTTS